MANLESQGKNKAMELLAGSLGNKDLLDQIVALDPPYSANINIIAALLKQEPAAIAALLSKGQQLA